MTTCICQDCHDHRPHFATREEAWTECHARFTRSRAVVHAEQCGHCHEWVVLPGRDW